MLISSFIYAHCEVSGRSFQGVHIAYALISRYSSIQHEVYAASCATADPPRGVQLAAPLRELGWSLPQHVPQVITSCASTSVTAHLAAGPVLGPSRFCVSSLACVPPSSFFMLRQGASRIVSIVVEPSRVRACAWRSVRHTSESAAAALRNASLGLRARASPTG